MNKPFAGLALAALLGCAQAPARAPFLDAVERDYAESIRWY
jgi:hypothetical protein